jgi:hypothetical protein
MYQGKQAVTRLRMVPIGDFSPVDMLLLSLFTIVHNERGFLMVAQRFPADPSKDL